MKRVAFALLLMILMSACGGLDVSESGNVDNHDFETYDFYYAIPFAASTVQESYDSEQRQIESGGDMACTLLTEFFKGPSSERLCMPYPDGTEILNYECNDGLLTIELSEECRQLSGIDLTIANCCLIMTMTQLDFVDTVQIQSPGNALIAWDDLELKKESFVLSDNTDISSDEYLSIYFSDENSRYLIADQRRFVVSENESTERYIVEQLIRGPLNKGRATMPEGTRVLGIRVEDGTCYVNFSSEFMINQPKTEAQERMTIYSIVNSLTGAPEIDHVQILVEGEILNYYRYMEIGYPLDRYEGIIGPANGSLNQIDVTFYIGSWSPDYLASIPMILSRQVDTGIEELVLKALISYEPPQGFTNLIPQDTKVNGITVEDGICYVDLSSEFIDNNKAGPALQRLSVFSIVMTLTGLKSTDIEAVQFLIDGSVRSFKGFSLEKPIYPDDNILFP